MKENRIKSILVCLGLIVMVVFSTLPVIYMVLVSLNKSADISSIEKGFLWTLQNYVSIFNTPSLHFLDYLKNSFFISLISSFCAVMIAALAAYALARLDMPGRMTVLLLVLSVSMFPQISLVGYLFKTLSSLDWINSYQGLIGPYIAWILPLSVWILVSYFSRIPKEIDQAAIVDGCTHLQVLWHILLPVILPGLFSCGLLAFIFSFNEFMFALMLTTDYHARTLPVGITLFQGLHGQIPWGSIMAASTITVFPVVIFVFIFQRNIIEDLTRGSVNG